ncbi:hypothetical protein CKM354_000463900 [Cercospora kikuchii]|uniref:Uncharacterized protein n=1 Tax=Cercospora kikuchii TaxID=84275 RepID=A0A9P3CH80_9PEZI|nr:uncharacterized protein CKM354_000463900 [Cercospora kikuchii]GIZ41332.1 hypothetical protein CKM354_000463900 [Cercospora kikuchii]
MATMQRLREEEDTALRGSEDEARALEEGIGAGEVEDSEEAPLRQRIILLPQELIDMILEKVFDDDPHARPRIRIDSNFKTPLALRLCHWTREKYVAKYYTRTTFILSAHKFIHSSFFDYSHEFPYEGGWCHIYEWREDEDGCKVCIFREQRPHPRARRLLCKWFRRESNGFFQEGEEWIAKLRNARKFYRRRVEDYEVERRALEPTNLGMQSVTSTVCLILLCLAVLILMIRESWRALSVLESTAGLSVRMQGKLTKL